MGNDTFRDLLILKVYDELNDRQAAELKTHLAECLSCRAELSELENLAAFLRRESPEPPEVALWQARQRLTRSLRTKEIASDRRWAARLRDWISGLPMMLRPAYACGAVAALAAGVALGYLLFHPGEPDAGPFDPLARPDIRISNVTLEQPDPGTRTVLVSFEAMRLVRMEGDVDDPRIQRVLTHALLSAQNPGVRLRAVDAIGSRGTDGSDPEILAALIGAMRTDPNPAVRHNALLALRRYPTTPELNRAFADVLVNDRNARLRIEAIEALHSTAGEGIGLEPVLIQHLERSLREDDNDFVRRRTQSLLETAGYNQF
jgi:hypothetical protein